MKNWYLLPLLLLPALCSLPSFSQTPPLGDQVLNQGLSSGVITPSDSIPLRAPTRAIFIGASATCNIALALANDSTTSANAVVWNNVQSGEFLPVSAKWIFATNTSCTNIVGIW